MSYEHINTTKQKSKKKRHCFFCGESILPNETYYKNIGKWEGYFVSQSYCNNCQNKLIPLYMDITGESEWFENDGQELISEYAQTKCNSCKEELELEDYSVKDNTIQFKCYNEKCESYNELITINLDWVLERNKRG